MHIQNLSHAQTYNYILAGKLLYFPPVYHCCLVGLTDRGLHTDHRLRRHGGYVKLGTANSLGSETSLVRMTMTNDIPKCESNVQHVRVWPTIEHELLALC